jgi:SPP1 gp7 family putative phage head morphogenesis protein
MKRQLTAAKPTPIKAPKSPRGIENELGSVIEFMVETMAKRFQNQVLNQLQVKTVEKFTDIAITVMRERKVIDGYVDRKRWQAEDRTFTDASGVEWSREERVEVEYRDPVYRTERYQRITVASDIKPADQIVTFEDAQTGNFASILLRLSKAASKSILKQFSNGRIDTITQAALGKLDKKSKEEFYKRVAAKTGINVADLIAKEGLKSTTNALVAETSQWIKTLRDDTFQKFTNNTLFAMSQGESLDTIVSQFDDVVSERKNHAKFLARNQVQNYNSITTKIRAQNLGITKAVWETAGDERVRPAHADREGKEFDLAEGLYSSDDGLYLLPGTDYNCRCTYTMIIPETVEEE